MADKQITGGYTQNTNEVSEDLPRWWN